MPNGRLIILRHGESEHNGKFFAGSRHDTRLTMRGEADIGLITDKIQELTECDIIYCSHMQRSRQTAEIISRKIKEKSGKNVPVIELAGIREVDGGDFSGLSKEEIRTRYPDAAAVFYDEVVANKNVKSIDFPGGENHQQVVERLKVALDVIQAQLKAGKEVAVVSHANTIRVLLDYLTNDEGAAVETERLVMAEVDTEKAEKRGIEEYFIHLVSWDQKN